MIEYTYKKTVTEIVNNEVFLDKYKNEIASWIFSLPALAYILEKKETSKDFKSAEIALEARYFTGKTPDITIIGKKDKDTVVVLIENKRWSDLANCKPTGEREVYVPGLGNKLHPCKQVEYYKKCLKYFNSYIQNNNINVFTAVYMQNGNKDESQCKFYERFKEDTWHNPVFVGKEAKNIKGRKNLINYLQRKIDKGEPGLAKQVYQSEVKISQGYLDILKNGFAKDFYKERIELFNILADKKQGSIIEKIKDSLNNIENNIKKVFIIEGTPGTGKSFIGLAILASIYNSINDSNDTKVCLYITKSKTQRWVLEKNEPFPEEPNLIDYRPCPKKDDYACIICDDSQRYAKTFFSKSNQDETIKTIIQKASVSVFFYDKKQTVHVADYINKNNIIKAVEDLNNDPKNIYSIIVENEYKLDYQYRAHIPMLRDIPFVDIIDNILFGFEKNNIDNIQRLTEVYEFALVESPAELLYRIKMKNGNRGGNHTSRVVAGKGRNGEKKVDWVWRKGQKTIGPFRNQSDPLEGRSVYDYNNKPETFITDNESVDFVGNIDVSYGLSLQYVGVIIAPDLEFSNGRVKVNLEKGHQHLDNNIIGYLTEEEKQKTNNEKKDIYKLKFDDTLKRFKKEEQIKNCMTCPILRLQKYKKITIGDLIRNTYRVLLTRGEEGCYIYCCNLKLQNYLAKFIPPLKRGKIIVVERDDNGRIKKALCESDKDKFEVSSETVNEMYEKRKDSIDNILKIDTEVTFIVKIINGIKNAVSIELAVPR